MPVTHDVCRFTAKRLLRPSLKLIGAKTKIRDLLYLHFPPHDVYVEPFLGTGGVLVGKPRASVEIVGDLNEYLINYYKVIQHQPAEFLKAMQSAHGWLIEPEPWQINENGDQYQSEDVFEEFKREIVKRTQPALDRAVLFYLITKHCFNGIWRLNEAGEVNSSWGSEIDGRGIFDEYWLELVYQRIAGVEFHVCRYQYLLSQARHAVLKGARSAFVFLDPPYHDCATTYNGEYFSDADFVEMASMLRNAPFKWLLTINDDQFIRDLFEGYSMIAHSVFYSCNVKGSERQKQPELLIANYELDPLPPVHQLSLFNA